MISWYFLQLIDYRKNINKKPKKIRSYESYFIFSGKRL